MTGREWKPGDVLLHPEFGRGLVVQYDNLGCPSGHRHTPLHVHYGDGEWDHINESRFRPLVVIDAEDREQVERLVKLLADSLKWGPHNLQRDTYCEPLQAALRQFANPKPAKPDEPQGLGAVVEQAGCRWTRARNQEHGINWREEYGGRWRTWDEFDAVRVLSEGVQP